MPRNKPLAAIIAVCGLALYLPADSAHTATQKEIVVSGSETLYPLNKKWAESYFGEHQDTNVRVARGGSAVGIQDLLIGAADIAASSRPLTAAEEQAFIERHGAPPKEIVVALDGIGIYVHNSNPNIRLSLDQLTRILSGDIRNWRELGGTPGRIDIYKRDRNSGTRFIIEESLLSGKPIIDVSRTVDTAESLTSAVSINKRAIGFAGLGSYVQGAHIVRLSTESGEAGYWPTEENVISGKYPLSRLLRYYILPDNANAAVEDYVDWVLSKEGQQWVVAAGYYRSPQALDGIRLTDIDKPPYVGGPPTFSAAVEAAPEIPLANHVAIDTDWGPLLTQESLID